MSLDIDFSRLEVDNGNYRTQSLFREYRRSDSVDYVPYTLKEKDYDGYISMYRVYMQSDTEYESAKTLLGSWKHWEVLCEAPCFRKHIAAWRKERDIRDAAIGKVALIRAAKEGNTSAAKSLVDLATKRKAGRPSKDEVEGEKKKQAAIETKVSSILDRMANK